MKAADSMPDRVARGVTRVPLRTPTLPPATHTNAYLVGDDDFIVVEPASPFAPERRRLDAAIDARISLGHKLIGALVTHHHGDHVSGAWSLRERFGVPLVAHPLTAAKVSARGPVDRTVEEGEALHEALASQEIHVLFTPGHAPGHLCLHSARDGWMIAGDMVASVGTILIDPDDDGDMDHYLAQLERLAARAPTRLLPAHGDPIDDAVARLRFYVAHRLAREAKVLAAVSGGASELGAIVARAYDDTPVTVWPLAARSARAHLARLARRGQIEERRGRFHPTR